jgi:hypothetical protein
LNAFLDAIQGRIYEIQKDYTLRKEPLTAELVIQKLVSTAQGNLHSIVEVFEYHNDQFEKLVGSEYSVGTLKKFKTALSSLKSFIEWKYQLTDMSIS